MKKEFKKLVAGDFNFIKYGAGELWILEASIEAITICLEPCLNGFDVAIYDTDLGIVMPKRCLDIKDYDCKAVGDGIIAFSKGVETANEMLEEYFNKQ